MSKIHAYGVVILALLLVWLTACIRDTVLEDDLLPAHVRVQTTVKIGFQQPGTRASGVWEEGEYHSETTDKGDPFDSKIASMRVLAFSEGVLKANELYENGVNYVDGNTYYTQFGKKIEGTDTTYYMDMELMPGLYRFYLIANENDLWTPGLNALQLETARIDDMFAIQSMQKTSNNILSAYWYRYLTDHFNALGLPIPNKEPKGIPMVGVADLNIIANPNAAEGSPTLINPSINLKRTLAKLEVYLRNTDNANGLYPDANLYRFDKVVLSDNNREYNVFYGYDLNAEMPLGSSGLSVPIPVHTDHGEGATPRYSLHEKGMAYNQKAFFSYLAEYDGYFSSFPLNFSVYVEKMGQLIEYKIPVFQRLDATDPNSNKIYSIKRNYLYRVKCTLQGSGIIQVNYAVGDWELKDYETVLGYGFQLVRDGNTLTITNTMQACGDHSIKLEPIGTTTLTSGTETFTDSSPAIFNQMGNGDSKTFTLNIPENLTTGDPYLKVYYNNQLMETFTKK